MRTPMQVILSGLWLALKIALVLFLMHSGRVEFIYQRF